MTRMLGRCLALVLASCAGLLALSGTGAAETPPLRKLTVGAATSWFSPEVSPEDVKWRAPAPDGMKNAPIFGYAHRWKPGQPIPNAERVQMPLYRNFDSDDPKWWDEQLDEVLFTRPAFIFLIGRGCIRPEDSSSTAGPGNMCPYKLRMMADAVRRAAAEDAARFAMFLDTGATFALRRSFTRGGPERLDQIQDDKRDPAARFDLSDQPDSSGRPALWYFWDAAIRPWFDTVPRQQWYLFDDHGVKKPVIAFWGVTHRFTGHRGNATKLLRDIKARFVERYGTEPFFLLSSSWISGDPDLALESGLVGGVHDWFRPRFGAPTGAAATSIWKDGRWQVVGRPNGISSLAQWNGRLWGVTVPGFDCGKGCNVPAVDRRDGQSFQMALAGNKNAAINLIEGFNGPLEGTGVYRSNDAHWRTANQYLGILRAFNDPGTYTTRLQAEGADEISGAPAVAEQPFSLKSEITTLPTPEGGAWALEAAKPGDGFLYKQLYFDGASYRFIVRARAGEAAALRIQILVDGREVGSKTLPKFSDRTPIIIQIATAKLDKGLHDVGVMTDGKAELDWMTVIRARD